MIAFKTQLFLALLAAVGVTAQYSTTTSSTTSTAPPPSGSAGISPCILGCVSDAATAAGCTSFTDVGCVCTSTTFQTEASTCLTQKCTSDEVGQAQALQKAECASVIASGTGTPTDPGSTPTGTDTSVTTTDTTVSPLTPTPTTKPSTTSTGTTTSSSTSAATTSKSAAEQKRQSLGVVGALVAGVLGLLL